MENNTQAVISEVIAKLQGLLGKGPSQAGPTTASIPDFDNNFKKCVETAQTLAPEIQKLTSIYESGTKVMKLILGYSTVCKKYSSDQEQKLKQKIIGLGKDLDDLQRKSAQYADHARAIKELLSTTFWVFVGTPEFLLKGAIQSSDFNAIKFQRKKNLDINNWYKLLMIAVRSLEKYVLENYPTGINFNFSGQDRWNEIISGTSGSDNSAPTQGKKEETKPAEVKKEEIKKGEQLVLAVGQVEMKHGIFIQNSRNFILKVEGKFKSLQLNKSQGIVLEIRSCVSGIEIMNSKDVRILVKQSTPSVSVDTSSAVRLVLNQKNLNCDIVSSKASQFNISYEKEDGNESKQYLVGQQLITKWNPNKGKFETAIYDKFL